MVSGTELLVRHVLDLVIVLVKRRSDQGVDTQDHLLQDRCLQELKSCMGTKRGDCFDVIFNDLFRPSSESDNPVTRDAGPPARVDVDSHYF